MRRTRAYDHRALTSNEIALARFTALAAPERDEVRHDHGRVTADEAMGRHMAEDPAHRGRPKGPTPRAMGRFHSLPDSKRYAETDSERTEILARHHAVLQALGADAHTSVLCIVARWSSTGEAADEDDRLDRAQPDAWPWITWDGVPEDEPPSPSLLASIDGPYERWCHLFVNEGPRSALDELFGLVADDRCSGVMILPLDLSWIYHPYDGGGDVIAHSSTQRDALREQFVDWLSAHPLGL